MNEHECLTCGDSFNPEGSPSVHICSVCYFEECGENSESNEQE